METAAPEVQAPSPEVEAQDNEPISVGSNKNVAPEEKSSDPETVAQREERKWKLNIYGKEEEVDEPELVRRAQKASAADRQFQEAAETKKKAAEIENRYQDMVEELRQNPGKIFEVLGKDAHEWAEQILIEKLKYETASPEQKRMWDLEKENLTLKERQQLAEEQADLQKKQASEAEFNEVRSKAVNSIDSGIAQAVAQAGFSKPTPALVRRVAQKMLAYHSANDGELLDANLATKQVLDDIRQESIEVLDGLPESEYEKSLPKGFTEKLRKYLVSQVQSGPMTPKQRPSDATSSPSGKKRVNSSTDSFFKSLDEKYG